MSPNFKFILIPANNITVDTMLMDETMLGKREEFDNCRSSVYSCHRVDITLDAPKLKLSNSSFFPSTDYDEIAEFL